MSDPYDPNGIPGTQRPEDLETATQIIRTLEEERADYRLKLEESDAHSAQLTRELNAARALLGDFPESWLTRVKDFLKRSQQAVVSGEPSLAQQSVLPVEFDDGTTLIVAAISGGRDYHRDFPMRLTLQSAIGEGGAKVLRRRDYRQEIGP